MAPVVFGIVGGGWRTEFFMRVVRALPERFAVAAVVVRDAERGRAFERAWGVPTVRGHDDLLRLWHTRSDKLPQDWYDLASRHDMAFDLKYRRALIARGVYQFPLPAKQGSISAAHTEADVDFTLDATDAALKECA